MSRYALIWVSVLALGLGGCVALDWLAGVTAGGEDRPGAPPAEIAGGVLGIWLPWAGTALTTLAGVYADFRGRRWKRAARSTFDAVESLKGTPLASQVKAVIATHHTAAKIAGFLEPIFDRYGHTKKAG